MLKILVWWAKKRLVSMCFGADLEFKEGLIL